jgi:MFS family permease
LHKKSLIFGWTMWFIVALFYALDYFQHTAPSVLIQPMAESLNLNVFSIGNIMSIYFPIYAISQIPAGYILDKLGYRLALPLASLIISLGIFVTAGADSYSLILTGRVLVAIGSAFAFIGALKVASIWLSEKTFPIAVGITNTIGVLGGIFGQVLLNWIIIQYSWRTALSFIGLFGILIAIIMFVFLKSPENSRDQRIKENIAFSDLKVLKSFQLWTLALYAGIMVGTVVVAFGELYVVLFLYDYYGITAQHATAVSSMIFIGIAVGGPTHGIISSFFENKKIWMLIGNIATIALFCITVVFAKSLSIWMLYFLYFFLGFFVSSMLLAFTVGREIFPKQLHGITMAFINMIIGLSGALFQPLAGEILKITNAGNTTSIANPDTFIRILPDFFEAS